MKLAAWSDGHGTLPFIEKHVDVLIIAGDIMPLYIQRNMEDSLLWFETTFFNYVEKVDADKVLLVPGNHDFLFEKVPLTDIKKAIQEKKKVADKLVLLVDEAYEYKYLKFYGCPWCTGPIGWAFSPSNTFTDTFTKYDFIPDNCDILITHQPPKVEKVGCSNPYTYYERDFGSDHLRKVLEERHVKLAFCGHIHTGTHNGVPFENTIVYNVSLKNEEYDDVFPVTYLSLDKIGEQYSVENE